jgi:hypothetical protein
MTTQIPYFSFIKACPRLPYLFKSNVLKLLKSIIFIKDNLEGWVWWPVIQEVDCNSTPTQAKKVSMTLSQQTS